MNKERVVSEVIDMVRRMRWGGSTDTELKRTLIQEGWPVGAVLTAMERA